jgi:protein-tyrosine-phosphatase
MTAELPEVLFVCVHNAGRSQMAAVRPIRDDIEQRVRGLTAELGIPAVNV